MIVVVAADRAEALRALLEAAGETVHAMGRVPKGRASLHGALW